MCVEVPANSKATGFLAALLVNVDDPESPPALKLSSVMAIWSTNLVNLFFLQR